MNEDNDAGIWWDSGRIMETAVSMQHAANKLDRDGDSPKTDMLGFQAAFCVVPVLLTLGTEIALKALYCQERRGEPPRGHNLVTLFDGLSEATRARLERLVPEVPDPFLPGLPGLPPYRRGIRDILDSHRSAFIDWRYTYELTNATFQTGEMKEVLDALIRAHKDKAREVTWPT